LIATRSLWHNSFYKNLARFYEYARRNYFLRLKQLLRAILDLKIQAPLASNYFADRL
jgi:hypothetical protein